MKLSSGLFLLIATVMVCVGVFDSTELVARGDEMNPTTEVGLYLRKKLLVLQPLGSSLSKSFLCV